MKQANKVCNCVFWYASVYYGLSLQILIQSWLFMMWFQHRVKNLTFVWKLCI